MTVLKEILLQLFLALMPFLMFSVYYRDQPRNFTKKFIVITGLISLFLSMTFGASAVSGYFFDIRYVIVFFGLIFGGLQAGIILLLEFVLYRLYLGGDGTGLAMLIMTIMFPLSLLLWKLYLNSRRKMPVILLAGSVFSLISLLLVYLHNPDSIEHNLMFYIVVIPAQNFIGSWLLISLFQKAVIEKEVVINYAQNEKVEMISQVAASLVHEVRNPLTAVKGFLKLIRESALERDRVHRYIDICVSELERTEYILSEYLSMSKPLKDHQESTDLRHLLRATLEVMRPYANMNNVGLEEHYSAGPVWILANPEKTKQVLMNLIKNAIEACYDIPDGKVSLDLTATNGKATLIIEDNGIGMTEDQIDRLGSVFFSTKSKGTGLGLSFSYQAIRAMGGTVSLKSVHRAGTRFTIMLPLSEQAAG
ncbi:two-component system sporulation sensor kinase B [Fontibacillus phaseoli]|uniref:histidine kinase n=1 Tax=Fontibacillus phaseoli TaxID=1416533 RepID=A0A369BJE6_9BACL|nr:sensor histidine kinase [Fontibacillus phaseoli]RCX20696.1 two-component system sporulation sensor kinase B [Fontibacillus phaseoli]